MTEDQIRRLIAEMKHDIERLFHRDIKQVTDTLARIEHEVITTNGRVTRLEEKAIRAEATATARAEIAKDAAERVADKAAEAIASKERSRSWWVKVIGAVSGGIAALATIGSLLGSYLHAAH